MRILICLLFLAACGAQPAPEFLRAERADVMRDGRTYTVYFTEKRVEVIRLGYARNGEHQAASLQGDSGEMRGSLSC